MFAEQHSSCYDLAHTIMERPGGYIDVDKLQAETTLEVAAGKCGVSLNTKGSGTEVRMDCPFNCPGDHAGRKEIAININNPQKVFQCHAYHCEKFRGNLLTLMHGWVSGQRPLGGKLKGEEFQRVKRILAGTDTRSKNQSTETQLATQADVAKPSIPPLRNVALIDSADEKVRELHNIDEKFITDIAAMNPAAAAYARKHPCLTPESMKKWRVGYLPNDGGGDKRGWSLRGSIVYPVFSEAGKVLCWVARDVHHEQKEKEFQSLVPGERGDRQPPAKHRFPKGFHRGQELFGQQVSRLDEPGYREFIAKHGLIIVEGFNDVINLDNLNIPSLAIMSNNITESQVNKITGWAKQLANGRVNLMFDNDPPGIEGAKEALWLFTQQKLDMRITWSPTMRNGTFDNKQPELMTTAEITAFLS